VKPDDIISYHDVVHAEKAALQKGMNFDLGKGYSVFVMSVRKVSESAGHPTKPVCY
jgi:predicted amidohydrolase